MYVKKSIILALAVTLFSYNSFAEQSKDRVLASFNNRQIKEKEISEYYDSLMNGDSDNKSKKFADLEDAEKRGVVLQYANFELLKSSAKNSPVVKDPEFKKLLENTESRLMVQAFISDAAKNAVTPAAVEEEMKKIKDSISGRDEVKFSFILCPDQKEADSIKDQLVKDYKKSAANGKESFARLAQKHSADQNTKNSGGSISRYVRQGEGLPTELESLLFSDSIKKGSGIHVVKAQLGYFVVKLDDKRPIKEPTQAELKSAAEVSVQSAAAGAFIEDLKKKSNFKVMIGEDTSSNTSSSESLSDKDKK